MAEESPYERRATAERRTILRCSGSFHPRNRNDKRPDSNLVLDLFGCLCARSKSKTRGIDGGEELASVSII